MVNYSYEIEQLEKGNRDPKLIERIISKRKPRSEEIIKFYERYTNEDTPIKHRDVKDPMEINHQINVDYFSEIIDIKTGYFAGNEVSYKVNQEAEEEWKDFKNRNRLADIDSETTKNASIGGLCVRLLLVHDKDHYHAGKEYMVMVPANEVILLGRNGADEADYGIRFYEIEVEEDKKESRVELWEAGKVTDYAGDSMGSLEFIEESKHVFDFCPMWGYVNNEEEQGDAEKVLDLIDEFNMALSDAAGEHEAFRSAILAFFGVAPPDPDRGEEELDTTKNLTLYLAANGEVNQDAKFITKTIQDAALEHFFERVESLIYRMSKTPNFSDSNFAGTITGVALKHKIQPLENKCSSFERKFASANIRMFELLGSAWAKRKKITLNPYEVEQVFTRNLPKDLLYEAQVQTELKGNVSDETRLAQFPGIDVDEEIKRLAAQEDAFREIEREDVELEAKLKGGGGNGSVGTSLTGNTKETE